MEIKDIVEKRVLRWQEGRGIEYDTQLCEAAAREICSHENLMREVVERPYLLIPCCFQIVDKHKDTVPFFLNEVQQEFIDAFEKYGGGRPYFILKGRQQGFTSLITAMQLAYSIVRKNFAGFTLADSSDNTRAIFNDKARVTYNRLPQILHPQEKYNSVTELFFDKLNSSWRISTATDQVGRSRTLSFVHYSEVAFFQCSLANLQKSIGEACTQDAVVIYETTANGFNEAKGLWDSESCRNLFFGWWKTAEYTERDLTWLDKAKNDGWLSQRVKVLREEFGLSDEQIAWYCRKYDGYLDKTTIKQEYPITPEEAFVASGNSIFDMEKITNRMAEVSQKQWRVGEFTCNIAMEPVKDYRGHITNYETKVSDIVFNEKPDGCIAIHEEPKADRDERGRVVNGCPYVIGGDTAGTGIDYFTAKVLDNTNEHCVATLRVQSMDEDQYALQIYCLAKYYNDALIGLETNYSRYPVRALQEKFGYTRLYMRESMSGFADKAEMVPGFNTTAITKPIILQGLVEKFRTDPHIECDLQTLKEMATFVKKENGKQEAIAGCHDDLVMASAIAHHITGQQTRVWERKSYENEAAEMLKKLFGAKKKETGNAGYMNWGEI